MEIFNSGLGFIIIALVLILVGTLAKMLDTFLDKHGIETPLDQVGEELQSQGEEMIFVSDYDDSDVILPEKEVKVKTNTIKRKVGRPRKDDKSKL